jgi:hypothetical protein
MEKARNVANPNLYGVVPELVFGIAGAEHCGGLPDQIDRVPHTHIRVQENVSDGRRRRHKQIMSEH